MTPIIFKTLTLKELYQDYLHKYKENFDIISLRLPLMHASLSAHEIIFCAFDQNKLIGALAIEVLSDKLIENKYVVVDEQYRQQGIAKELLRHQFQYAKNLDYAIINSIYSSMGKNYLKNFNQYLAQESGVLFFEAHEKPENLINEFNTVWNQVVYHEEKKFFNEKVSSV